MRIGIFSIAIWIFWVSASAQQIHYFRVEVGPKYDAFEVKENENISPQFKTDVGAGFFVGKRFTESAFAELGIIKHDYVSKIEVTTHKSTGDNLVSFGNRLLSSFNSVQLGLLGGYEWQVKPRINVHAKGGFQLFLNRTLKQEGSATFFEEAKNTDIGYAEPIQLIMFSNGLEAGNLIFRGDVGMNYYFGNRVFLEASISARIGNTTLSEYQVEYQSQSMLAPRRATISTSGRSIGFNIGIRYRLANF